MKIITQGDKVVFACFDEASITITLNQVVIRCSGFNFAISGRDYVVRQGNWFSPEDFRTGKFLWNGEDVVIDNDWVDVIYPDINLT